MMDYSRSEKRCLQEEANVLSFSITIKYHPEHTCPQIMSRVFSTRGTFQFSKTEADAYLCEISSIVKISTDCEEVKKHARRILPHLTAP